ncbi:BRCA1 C-terminus domain-containing protein [Phytophthora infestans]|uniref:RING-type E3 ubiquitin transferase BRCA1 n=1 Tax=Phytophthora infestans TaxID=4787 RepID=A0A833TR44_PHYIN|nr:BRCA1 C-terminus domain-containing protein [Phytophthora infestans]
MALILSSPRLEAVRLIREQLSCTLCGKIFQDPQCLDCKHNFCLQCILLHLKRNNSQCPICQLPTRPSEVTRNQFLESILAAWNGVETELEALNGDPTQHATKITVDDTDKALHRAASGSGTTVPSTMDTEEEKHKKRGPVGNNKWNIDTQEIRQELRLEQPYLPQNYGSRQGSSAYWKKTSSSDLPDDYAGSSSASNGEGSSNGRSKNDKSSVSLDQASAEDAEEEKQNEKMLLSPPKNSLMATQEVESYLDRISKQREALSQWERTYQAKSSDISSLSDLERSLHSSNSFDELLKERRRASQHDEDGDLLTQMTQMTQMPPATSTLESPDLLSSFRRQHTDSNESERRPAKRRVLLSSPLSLHPRGRISSPSRKRLRMPTLQDDNYQTYGRNIASAIDLSKAESDEENEVPDSQPATVLPEQEYKSSDDCSASDDDGDEEYKEEEEYEMKPAVPLPPSPEHKTASPDPRTLLSRKKERVSDDFRSAITAFQCEEKNDDKPKSQAAKRLVTSASHTAATTRKSVVRPSSAGNSKPPVHTSKKPANSDNNFVFVSSDLAREEVKRVLEATQRLGGKFGHDFDLKRDPVTGRFCTSVTHLVTKAVPPIGASSGTAPDELRCKRTAKYMRALAEGSFVMDFSWVKASLAAGRWLTEDPFEVIGDIYSDAVGKPHEGRIRRVQTGRRNSIFSIFCFVLLVSEKEFDFQFASVKALVNNFGGTVVHAEKFSKDKSKQRSRRTPVGVVSKATLPSDAKAKWQQFQIPIVRITWIFDSVSHLEVLPFDDYYPY